MSDKSAITVGLALFLAVVLFPVWQPLVAAGETAAPELELPEDASKCIEDTDYMTTNHMELLDQWRDAVVRDGQRVYTSSSGEKHVISLTGSCMSCHSSREAFCTRCHDYADVEPTCWDCHVEPGGKFSDG
jgi:hypothetical protein